MSVPAAYAGVVIIWATTPLAIKWSSQGPGILFGASGRMVIGALLCLLLLRVLHTSLPWHRRALQTYTAGALAVYGAMLSVYWAAQHIPSGLVSVVFGLTPIVTSLMAAFWLQERSLSPLKLIGMLCGAGGLVTIFGVGAETGPNAVYGIAAVVVSVLLHSASSVWVKRLGADLSALAVTAGSVLFATPMYLVTWGVVDGALPATLPTRATLAIVYLGVLGSFVGFLLYYYALRRLQASHIALITLVTPVLALLIGHWFDDEPLGAQVWMGTAMILFGLGLHQWGAFWRRPLGACLCASSRRTPQALHKDEPG